MFTAMWARCGRGMRCAVAAAVAIFLASSFTLARPLAPGESIDVTDPLTGTSLAERPELAGDIIFELTQNFSGDAFSGTLQTRVVRETDAGTLDFYYRVDPTLDSYSVTGFNGFSTDVDFRTDLPDDPGPHGASGAARTADGDTIHFVFRGGWTFVQTNATDFRTTGTATFPPNNVGDPVTIGGVAVPIPLPPAVYAGAIG